MVTTTLFNRVGASVAAFAVLASSALVVTPAFATSNGPTTHNLSIPINTIVRKVGVGNTKQLAKEHINEKYQGMVCDVTAHAENQGSIHPNNDLIVASGDTSVTLEDVERESNVLTEATGTLTLGDKVTVSLLMGDDNVFSGGMDVKIECEKEIEVCRGGEIITIRESERTKGDTDKCPTLIEVCRDHEIITIDEKNRKAGDTDTCPGKITVCRDNAIVTIYEDEKLESDTNVCPEVQVCRDGEIISVSSDKVLDTDTEECPVEEEPEVLGEKTLPKTGAGAIVTAGLGLSTVISGLYGFVNKRR